MLLQLLVNFPYSSQQVRSKSELVEFRLQESTEACCWDEFEWLMAWRVQFWLLVLVYDVCGMDGGTWHVLSLEVSTPGRCRLIAFRQQQQPSSHSVATAAQCRLTSSSSDSDDILAALWACYSVAAPAVSFNPLHGAVRVNATAYVVKEAPSW